MKYCTLERFTLVLISPWSTWESSYLCILLLMYRYLKLHIDLYQQSLFKDLSHKLTVDLKKIKQTEGMKNSQHRPLCVQCFSGEFNLCLAKKMTLVGYDQCLGRGLRTIECWCYPTFRYSSLLSLMFFFFLLFFLLFFLYLSLLFNLFSAFLIPLLFHFFFFSLHFRLLYILLH